MSEAPRRLFDLPGYQLARFPQPDMLCAKENGSWKPYATAEVCGLIASLAAGLVRAGIGPGDGTPEGRDKVAILSVNRPEWIIADQACQRIGAVVVPVYPTAHPHELAFILKETAVKLVFAGDASLVRLLEESRETTGQLPRMVVFEAEGEAPSWKTLLVPDSAPEHGEVARISASVRTEDIATIIFTSGTTGTPKGVMLSHGNILSNVLSCFAYLPVTSGGKALSFLPLNHVYERMIDYLYIYAGVSIYYAESMETIADNLREVRPQIFTTVPRLLEKVYERILEKGAALTGLKKKLFDWSLALGARFDIRRKQGGAYGLQLWLARRLVFSKWREALGGRIRVIVTGSAPCQVRLLRLFTAAGIHILEGYGLTESSPVICVNRMERKDRMFGTVGPAIAGVEVRIAQDGEILCKGPNVMAGYYRRPDLTAETVIDGWLHTGDIGELAEGRFLKITDRKKELFKTSGGKYVAPQPIENKLKESPFIAEVMVVGAGMKFPAALIVPDFRHLERWCAARSLPTEDRTRMIRHPEVLSLFREEVARCNTSFSHVEQVKKFELLTGEWTVASGELSQALKLRRKVILEKYQSVIDGLYS